MWSDFLKKAIANVEQFTYENTGFKEELKTFAKLSSSTLTSSDIPLPRKYIQGTRKSMQERLVAIVSKTQDGTNISNSQHYLKTDDRSIYLDKGIKNNQKIFSLEYESTEVTENRCSYIFPATMPNFIEKIDVDNDYLKNELKLKNNSKNNSVDKKLKTNNISSSSSSIFNDSNINMISFDLKKIIDEKDRKISMLLEEGNKLSKNELKHIAIIKDFRSKIKKKDNTMIEMENKIKKLELEIAELKEKLECSSKNNKWLSDHLAAMVRLEMDYDTIKKERDRLKFEKNDLLKSLENATALISELEKFKYSEALESEKSKSLFEALNIANSNLTLLEKENKSEINALNSYLQTERNKFLAKEKNYIDEIFALETKIEALRNNLEEISFSTDASAYVKLLRENEALHVQYLTASQQWREKEDDLYTKNVVFQEENKKYLEIIDQKTLKLKYLEEEMKSKDKELEKLKIELSNSENIIKYTESLNVNLIEKISKLEETIIKMNISHNGKLKELNTSLDFHCINKANESEHNSNDKDILQIPVYISDLNKPTEILSTNNNLNLLNKDSDSSGHNKLVPDVVPDCLDYCPTPNLLSCYPLPNFKFDNNDNTNISNNNNTNGDINGDINGDYFIYNLEHFTSPSDSLFPLNFSDYNASTTKTGININIIQRLSSSVQMLEKQLIMARDGINLITQQRDEARKESIHLMIEVEKTKELQNKISILEKELKIINERYEKCLELLGEKSEKEEELKQDIKDMKELYTQQIEDLISKIHHS
ncbi:hypothetical protein PMAC_002839 [Pneumocystis sp. 'macacae']|nr:hypothetical protein PMAC_002839 [Pneumocystis sp. 'macacae']